MCDLKQAIGYDAHKMSDMVYQRSVPTSLPKCMV